MNTFGNSSGPRFQRNLSRNPLTPQTPGAPPWDPNATAAGIYVTDDLSIARTYALTVAEDDQTLPIVITIDIANLQLRVDPQAVDLLQEPYQLYRQTLLNKALNVYRTYKSSLKDADFSKADIRSTLGTASTFVVDKITQPGFDKFPVRADHPSAPVGFGLDKRDAAQAIFNLDKSWYLLNSFHKFYGPDAPNAILAYIGLEIDEEENPYSTNSVYISPAPTHLETAFWYYLSDFAYIAESIMDSDIAEICYLDSSDFRNTVYKRPSPAIVSAYHGTGLSRVSNALSDLIPSGLENLAQSYWQERDDSFNEQLEIMKQTLRAEL